MKKKSIKTPKQMTKREVALQDIQKLLRKAMAVKPLSVKCVVFNDGVYTALNEHDQPVAFFGEQFKQAIDQFLPEYKRFPSFGVALQPYQKEFLRRAEKKPISAEVCSGFIHYFVLASCRQAFEYYVSHRELGYYTFVTRREQLDGVFFGAQYRIVTIPGWDDGASSYLISRVLEAVEQQKRFDKHVGLS